MYRKDMFSVDAVIGMVKSTNHRFRVLTIFRRLRSAGSIEAVSAVANDVLGQVAD